MTDATLLNDLKELEGAEEFLEYFGISYDAAVVRVNRLHILQRFHDYLEQTVATLPDDAAGQRQHYASHLQQAYQDFVESDAMTEKVFKVFQQAAEPKAVYIPLDKAFR